MKKKMLKCLDSSPCPFPISVCLLGNDYFSHLCCKMLPIWLFILKKAIFLFEMMGGSLCAPAWCLVTHAQAHVQPQAAHISLPTLVSLRVAVEGGWLCFLWGTRT